MATWTHSKLGKFTFDDVCWSGSCSLPAFKAFKYGGSRRTKVGIEFEVGEETAIPSKRAISIVHRIVDNQEKLVSKIAGN